MPKLALRELGGFFALMAGAPAPELQALGDSVVRELDDLRHPVPDPLRRARRRPELMSQRQRELLDAWDYPYVFEEFRPHFTLTDRIAADQQPRIRETLDHYLSAELGRDLPIDALCVFEEPAPEARLHLRSVHPLSRVNAADALITTEARQ